MSSLPGRLERLEHLVRASAPTAEEPSARDQLRAKLKAISERIGPVSDRPDSEEVLAEVNARVEVLTRGTRGGGGR